MADIQVHSVELGDLIARLNEAANAYLRGDLRQYAALIPHGDEYTLMPPSGGETRAGFALTKDRVEDTRRTFTGGEARLEIAATSLGSDLAVIAAIERQHGQVGGLPAQDWSLRVTLVFQRDGQGSPWRMVHRHADPLVRQIPHEHLAVLARGLDTETPPPAR